MRKVSYSLTEISSYFFMKVCLAVVVCIVMLCSIQFFQAYQEYKINTDMLQKSIGKDASFRLIDVSAEEVTNQNVSGLIQDAEKVFNTGAYYFLENPGYYFADAAKEFYLTDEMTYLDEKQERIAAPKAVIKNEKLMEKIDLAPSVGKEFSENNFSGKEKGILLGNAYQKKFKVGEEIVIKEFQHFSQSNQLVTKDVTYRVNGFLPKQYEMLDFWQGSTEAISLDEAIIFPLSEDILQEKQASIQLQLLGYFFLLSPNLEQKFPYLEAAEQIRKYGQEHGYGYIKLQNDRAGYNSQMKNYQLTYKNRLYLLGLVLLFSFLQIGIILSFTFKKREPIYEIYFSIGSTKKEIFLVLVGEYLTIFLFGFSLMVLLKIVYLKEDWSGFSQLMGVLFYFAIFMFIAIASIGKQLLKDGKYFRRER